MNKKGSFLLPFLIAFPIVIYFILAIIGGVAIWTLMPVVKFLVILAVGGAFIYIVVIRLTSNTKKITNVDLAFAGIGITFILLAIFGQGIFFTLGLGNYAYQTYTEPINLTADKHTPIEFRFIVKAPYAERGGSINNPNPQAFLWKDGKGVAHIFVDKIDNDHRIMSFTLGNKDVIRLWDNPNWNVVGRKIVIPYEKLQRFGEGQHKLYIAYTCLLYTSPSPRD